MSDGEDDVDFDQEQPEVQRKGRGHDEPKDDFRYAGKSGVFETGPEAEEGIQKSIEGYVIFIRNINEETQEDDIFDHFGEFGMVTDLKFPLDRRSGYAKGYALVEYKTLAEAKTAIREGNGSELLEKVLSVDWAFKPAPNSSN